MKENRSYWAVFTIFNNNLNNEIMKKVLIIAFFIISVIGYSQQPSISPYYPDVVPTGSYNDLQTQMTYFDLNFVNVKIQDYMINEMQMNLSSDKYDLVAGKGNITFTYSDNGAINTTIKKMSFIFNVEPINDEFVIKSCKIVGNSERLISFYVHFWSSPLQFDQVKSKGVIYNNFMMDKISFHYNGNQPYITITNGSITDFKDFSVKYIEKRNKHDKSIEAQNIASKEVSSIQMEKEDIKEREIEKNRELAKEERELEAQKIKSRRYEVTQTEVKKKGNDFVFNENVSNEIRTKIKEELRTKDNGIYVLKVSIKYELEQPVETSIGAISYRKTKAESIIGKYF
jgi:hypothetical protein